MKLASLLTMLAAGASIAIYMQTPNWTILGAVLFVSIFFLSDFIGVFINSQIILLIIYNLPRSIYHYLRGDLRFIAIPLHFVAPIVWSIGLFVLGFILQALAPSVLHFLTTNLAVSLGQLMALVVIFLSMVTPSGLKDLRDDYDEKVWLPYHKVRTGAPIHYPYRER
jgi:hypothetical protein